MLFPSAVPVSWEGDWLLPVLLILWFLLLHFCLVMPGFAWSFTVILESIEWRQLRVGICERLLAHVLSR